MIAPQFRIAAGIPSGPLGIPGRAAGLQAGGDPGRRETPNCKLPWFLLAGIGRIESGHAATATSTSTETRVRRSWALPRRDAGGQRRHPRCAGNGARAMGPMQFIPSTWASWGSDANGDGKADPQNVFDATYPRAATCAPGSTTSWPATTRSPQCSATTTRWPMSPTSWPGPARTRPV